MSLTNNHSLTTLNFVPLGLEDLRFFTLLINAKCHFRPSILLAYGVVLGQTQSLWLLINFSK